MSSVQSDIPDELRRMVEGLPKHSDVSVQLTDEVLETVVKSARTSEKVDLVSADDRIVSFVDLLGTKFLMQQVSSKEQAQDAYNKLSAIGVLFEECAEECKKNVPDTKYRIISDSYVISVPNEPEALDALVFSIGKFQKGCLLEFKALARGGIAIGKMVVGGKYDMMIGKAFVDAHLLEKDIASYPRVVINSDIKIKEMSRIAPISHDKDGMDYISFLSGLSKQELEKARSIILDKKKEKSDPKCLHERQKWEWVQTYIDQVNNKHECCCVYKKEVV